MNKVAFPIVKIGLEVHITVKSKKKIFNWEDTYCDKISPNSQVGDWELGYLGTLPIINSEVIYSGLKLASTLGMKIKKTVIFDRKIYNYFDLPKGYQITQKESPLASSGYLPIVEENVIKKIPIKTLQLEEDTAKSIRDGGEIKIDFNRSGNPLIEIVTEPVFSQLKTVFNFIKQLQTLLRYLDVSEAKMEEGQLRIDLNFSLQFKKNYFTPRYEIKNLNSLANIEKALSYEINKHQLLFSQNKRPPESQTLGFDKVHRITVVQRKKTDYHYLPEVNIPPIKISSQEIKKIIKTIPVLPWTKWKQLVENKSDFSLINLILEKPFLLKSLVLLEKKNLLTFQETEQWIIFFLNYLGSYFFCHKNFLFFLKEWQSFWKIFQLWKKKEIETQTTKKIIEQLINEDKPLSYLIKKYRRDSSFNIDWQPVFDIWNEVWNETLILKYSTKPQNVKNFLIGQIKKKFPSFNIEELSQKVAIFISKKML